MSKEKNEAAVKEIIEYANNEITKSKKKHLTILLSILASIVLLSATFFFLFMYEMPVPYSEDLIEVNIPVDKGLDIKVNLSNYKNAKAFLAQNDEDTFDLYINVSQTLATKMFNDKDNSNNFLRVGNSMVVDYQSGLLLGELPSGYSDESVMNIYYIDKFYAKNITTKNGVLVWTRNSPTE